MENLLVALTGSLLVLDTTVAFQFLISQPLISCTLIGSLLGDTETGLLIGFYLQLLWLSSLPVGAAVVPEGNVAAIVISALVIKFRQLFPDIDAVIVFVFVYGLLISYLGGQIVILFRKLNSVLFQKTMHWIKSGRFIIVSSINLTALALHYLLMFILIFISLFIGDLFLPFIGNVAGSYVGLFSFGSKIILGIGAGLVLTLFRGKENTFFIIAGVIVGIIFYYLMN